MSPITMRDPSVANSFSFWYHSHNKDIVMTKCENVKTLILSDHRGSYRFHSPNVSENTKEQGVKLWLYFKEIATQAYLLQVKGYFILVFLLIFSRENWILSTHHMRLISFWTFWHLFLNWTQRYTFELIACTLF